jgi:hypothetical protein
VQSTPQMAENGKNRLAILTIFCFRRTDVKKRGGFEFLPLFKGVNILDAPLNPQSLLPQEKGRNIRFLVPLSCGRGARGEG